MQPLPDAPPDLDALKLRLKEIVIEVCDLDGVTVGDVVDDDRLIGGNARFHLGSLDALEIAAAIEKEWGVRIQDLSAAKAAFRSITSLAEHIARVRGWRG